MDNKPLHIAYADPPYIGQAKKHYAQFGGSEVDHQALIATLLNYDGWALSCSSPSLQTILALCPPKVRIAAWVKPFCSFKKNVNPAYAWEPVIYMPARKPNSVTTVRDWLAESITLKRGMPGAKPGKFSYWLFDLLGCHPDDHFLDMYPGSGAVTDAWKLWKINFFIAQGGTVNDAN